MQASKWGVMATSVLFASSCGMFGSRDSSDDTSGTAIAEDQVVERRSKFAAMYGSITELPACGGQNAGEISYVLETELFYSCVDDAWTAIAVGNANDQTTAVRSLSPGPECPLGGKQIVVRQNSGANDIVNVCFEPGGVGGFDERKSAAQYYNLYRKSVYRLAVKCTSGSGFLASAFLCGAAEVCTNRHAVDPAGCPVGGAITQLTLEAPSNTDAVGAIFFSTVNPQPRFHQTRDLAKFTVTGIPSGAVPLPIPKKDELPKEALRPTLSLSFPLGFRELYSDLGAIDANALASCPNPGVYCPADYDFSTDNNTDHGSSGSPIIDIFTGKLMGITTAGPDGENANFTWALDGSRFGDF